jgi:hypothetical protein
MARENTFVERRWIALVAFFALRKTRRRAQRQAAESEV